MTQRTRGSPRESGLEGDQGPTEGQDYGASKGLGYFSSGTFSFLCDLSKILFSMFGAWIHSPLQLGKVDSQRP